MCGIGAVQVRLSAVMLVVCNSKFPGGSGGPVMGCEKMILIIVFAFTGYLVAILTCYNNQKYVISRWSWTMILKTTPDESSIVAGSCYSGYCEGSFFAVSISVFLFAPGYVVSQQFLIDIFITNRTEIIY